MSSRLKIQSLALVDLSSDPANMRTHPEANIRAIMASLRRWGQQKPIVIDNKRVVRAGNGTLEAARRLGWTHISCVVSDLSGAELQAFAIADNRTAELAEWSAELGDVLAGLHEELPDLDAEALGFDALAAVEALAGSEPPDPSGPPAAPPRQAEGTVQSAPSPSIDRHQYTDRDVAGAAADLTHLAERPHQQIEVMCPKCGEEFLIDG